VGASTTYPRIQSQFKPRRTIRASARPVRPQSRAGPSNSMWIKSRVCFLHNQAFAHHVRRFGQASNHQLLRQREDDCLIRCERDSQRITKPCYAAIQARAQDRDSPPQGSLPAVRRRGFHRAARPRLRAIQGLRAPRVPPLFAVSVTIRLARHHLIIREMRNLSFPPGRRQKSEWSPPAADALRPRPLQKLRQSPPTGLIEIGRIQIERQEGMPRAGQ